MKSVDFATVKKRVSIIDVLKHYLDDDAIGAYSGKKGQLRGSCIFCVDGHKKERRGLSINTTKNIFQSFCCKEKGDIFNFVAAKEKVTVGEARDLLVKWFDIESEKPGNSDEEADRVFQQSDSVNKPLSFELKNIDHGHEKVKALEISEETATHFGVGYYCGRGMMKERVVFPVHDENGALIAYAGLESVKDGYLYPKQFNRAQVLYNAHRAAQASKSDNVKPTMVKHPHEVLEIYDQGRGCAVVAMMGESPSAWQNSWIAKYDIDDPNIVATGDGNVASYSTAKPLSGGDIKETEVDEGSELDDDTILAMANEIARKRLARDEVMDSSSVVKTYLYHWIEDKERENFVCVFLDNRHRVIATEILFKGTVNGCTVHSREVVVRAIKLNASAVIIGHNHPSGLPTPSESDRKLTVRIKESLALLDIRVLDHIIVGAEGTVSLSDEGMM